jgi:hypothetical protein
MVMKISKEWANYEIFAYSKLRKQQLKPLWKKLIDHKECSCHEAAVKLAEVAQKEMLENVCMKSLSCEKEITAKVFHMVYKLAKKNQSQSSNNFEDEINVQELTVINMGFTLHSINACINIINHTASKMRNNLVKRTVSSKRRISLVTAESDESVKNLQ